MYRRANFRQLKIFNKDINSISNYDLMHNDLFFFKKGVGISSQVVQFPEYNECLSFVRQTSDIHFVSYDTDKKMYSKIKFILINKNDDIPVNLVIPKFSQLVETWNVVPENLNENTSSFQVTLGPSQSIKLTLTIIHDKDTPKLIYHFIN